MAARNPISAEYQEHVMKYLPAMREPEFNLSRAADYLESWLQGTLSLQPPLELSDCFGIESCSVYRYPRQPPQVHCV